MPRLNNFITEGDASMDNEIVGKSYATVKRV